MFALLIGEIYVVVNYSFKNLNVKFGKIMNFKNTMETDVIEEERIPQERSPDPA